MIFNVQTPDGPVEMDVAVAVRKVPRPVRVDISVASDPRVAALEEENRRLRTEIDRLAALVRDMLADTMDMVVKYDASAGHDSVEAEAEAGDDSVEAEAEAGDDSAEAEAEPGDDSVEAEAEPGDDSVEAEAGDDRPLGAERRWSDMVEEEEEWAEVLATRPRRFLTNTTHRQRMRMRGSCWVCNQPGHLRYHCPQVTGIPPPDVSLTNTTAEWRQACMREGKCFECQSTEHIAKRCPFREGGRRR
eukprot:jgi/Tetstr1/464192/TSEL_008997.t1